MAFDFENNRFKPFEKKLYLSSPTMHGEELEYVTKAYKTNWMSTLGENINEVERITCEKLGCKYAVALSAGTAALHLAMKLAGQELYGQPAFNKGALDGKRVFASDMTFDATVNPICYEGGIPVFIDTEEDTWNMDPVSLEKAFEIYPEVKLVVIAHLYGTPGKIDELREICDRHGAIIIEDAAESLGAKYRSKYKSNEPEGDVGRRANAYWRETGTFGEYNCISFNGNNVFKMDCYPNFCNKSIKISPIKREIAT